MQPDEEYMEIEDESKESTGPKGRMASFLNGKYFVPVIIILVAIIGFALGRISGLQEKREPVRVLGSDSSSKVLGEVLDDSISPPNPRPNVTSGQASSRTGEGSSAISESGMVVASKNGTKYHYPWCAGAKQIADKNKITFSSIEEARASGYTPASNCKGLE